METLIDNSDLEIFRELFNEQYTYCFMNQISDKNLSEYLQQEYVSKRSISGQLDLCYDWCLSQQQCDVQE